MIQPPIVVSVIGVKGTVIHRTLEDLVYPVIPVHGMYAVVQLLREKSYPVVLFDARADGFVEGIREIQKLHNGTVRTIGIVDKRHRRYRMFRESARRVKVDALFDPEESGRFAFPIWVEQCMLLGYKNHAELESRHVKTVENARDLATHLLAYRIEGSRGIER